ncbi:flagellar basal-body rod modification protein FlgD [Motilibacter peucedani]|uniref:Flagellar basal-body rod modification protein FlgD n=1 Tax=Motilibacter peucedani TaxID=598650 RepID=A0A420XTG9_9ACTN|nr:flagellar hook capping FlgD N-terminal domain-containing protein [Motilibacter peucedani]RKS80128.1 flagellar basal-body rod modification protein FlgD [Motilibacter peucedani]
MAVAPTSSYTPIADVLGAKAPSEQKPKTSNDELDKDAFLKLLVAQLKYQDPSKPMDSSEFMAQTAQFTSVEKLTTIAEGQASMIAASNFQAASSMVGRSVTYPGADNVDVTGVVSSARFSADGPVLRVGDKDVPLTSVKEVTAAPATA